jgi:hypothetical protein
LNWVHNSERRLISIKRARKKGRPAGRPHNIFRTKTYQAAL